ncbi:MAG: ammonium transporter [Coriobacteriales bacterium]|jgi:Amt family ammonium transporter|nr:ammonium transporter [Coriobacteriales bacterium]
MYDTGATAFMLVSVAIVTLMSPALALFYGGLSRRKNVINTMLMSIMAMAIVGVTWVLIGDSIAYGGASEAFDEKGSLVSAVNLFFGGLERVGSSWATADVVSGAAATAQAGVMADAEYASYPGVIDIAFQAAFAMVTTAIVTGSLAGRVKFGAACALAVVWPVFVYAPLAHMVWGGGLIGSEFGIGAIDFAGGDVVHISSGVSGLVLAVILGKRRGFDALTYRPHNVPFVMLGAGLLFMGWFGFNGGSALAADGIAGLAVLTTLVSACAAAVSWCVVERVKTGNVTLVGACTGLIAGLVVITPAAGFVEPWAAVVMGLLVSPVCFFAIAYAKKRIGYDDALDAFGCHGVGGIVGGILTGVFCHPDLTWIPGKHGLLYGGGIDLLGAQLLGIIVTLAYILVVVGLIGLVLKAVCKGKLRVPVSVETEGLDTAVHGENAYPAFNGLD